MGLVTLTKQSSRGTFNLNQDDIVKMYEKSSTTIIEYIDQENGILKSEAVSEDIADVFALTTNLAQTTIGGVTLYLNASRVIYTTEINSLAVVNYNNGGAKPEVLKLDVDEATFIASLPSGMFSLPYKSYIASLTQTGTNAPVATVIYNELSGTPAEGYVAVGTFSLTLASAFPTGKVFIMVGTDVSGASTTFTNAYRGDDNTIYLEVLDMSTGAGTNGALGDTIIEIRVYD